MTNYQKAIELQKAGNYSMRSCWECNGSHEHLKTVGGLFTCTNCGKWYMNGGFFNDNKHRNTPFLEFKPQQFIKINVNQK